MRSWLVALVALGGCDFIWRIDGFADAKIYDDAFVLPDAGACDGTIVGHGDGSNGLLRVCVPSVVPHGLSYTLVGSVDTSLSINCDQVVTQQDGTQLCVITARQIFVSNAGGTDTKGFRPLVLVGLDLVEVTGNLNAGAKANGTKGAGSNYAAACASSPGGKGSGGFGGGGGGGSFATGGGNGGPGKGPPGAASPPAPPDHIRGGCAGGRGGEDGANARAASGDSGGAIYLMSNTRINVQATINASGAGGSGGTGTGAAGLTGPGGGGGGGSGGMIGLDAPSIVVGSSAVLFADGGGGGAGGSLAVGPDGEDATMSTYLGPIRGGQSAVPSGPSGGDGAAGTQLEGTFGVGGTAGGGGGGGFGYILLYTSAPAPVFMSSPAPRLDMNTF